MYTSQGAPEHNYPVLFGHLKCGGPLFDRHDPPLTRRFVVHYCSAVYTDVQLAQILPNRCENPGLLFLGDITLERDGKFEVFSSRIYVLQRVVPGVDILVEALRVSDERLKALLVVLVSALPGQPVKRVRAGKPALRSREVPRPKVIEARLGISFLAGKPHAEPIGNRGKSLEGIAGVASGLAVPEFLAKGEVVEAARDVTAGVDGGAHGAQGVREEKRLGGGAAAVLGRQITGGVVDEHRNRRTHELAYAPAAGVVLVRNGGRVGHGGGADAIFGVVGIGLAGGRLAEHVAREIVADPGVQLVACRVDGGDSAFGVLTDYGRGRGGDKATR